MGRNQIALVNVGRKNSGDNWIAEVESRIIELGTHSTLYSQQKHKRGDINERSKVSNSLSLRISSLWF